MSAQLFAFIVATTLLANEQDRQHQERARDERTRQPADPPDPRDAGSAADPELE
jgi:hypothetical protein